jgi:MFS family permease
MMITELIEIQPAPIISNHNQASSKDISESSHLILSKGRIHNVANGDEAFNPPTAPQIKSPSKLQLTITILQPCLVNFFASFTNGIITVGLPVMAKSLSLQRSLYVWPSSVYGLTSGSMLLIAGSAADLVGPRNLELVGMFGMGIFTLACGLSATGIQLVLFRALQGIAMAMHLPSSVAIVAAKVPEGRARNIGFGCLGLSQPLGFSVGLVISGIMIERIGWRTGFYICGSSSLLAAIVAVRILPNVEAKQPRMAGLALLKSAFTHIDWVGGALASGGLALLSYFLAYVPQWQLL